MENPLPHLAAIPSTLRIPLAIRAYGERLFPEMDVHDSYARDLLARMGDAGQQWLSHRQSVFGTLARIHSFRAQAQAFIAQYPTAQVINLGCGLSDYYQWIDNGSIHLLDADLPEVMALRHELMPAQNARQRLADIDLTQTTWWDDLQLPPTREAEPLFIMSEGVFMYLMPETITQIFRTFGKRAPAGSILTFDVMCWLSVGRAKYHPSVKQTPAEFHWGVRKLSALSAAHPRLKLQSFTEVMGSYNFGYKILQPLFKALTGVPFYAIYTLTVTD